jgi:molecular chaperone Hsp33
MSGAAEINSAETGYDNVLSFSIPGRNARGRSVRLGPVLDAVLSAHDYPPAIRHLLSEALVLTALLGSLLKDEGSQLTMQAQAQGGAVQLLVCDFREGELRGYVEFEEDVLGNLGSNPSLDALFGEGYLAVTFDLSSSDQRYQGIVPLEGDSLARACESYFLQSEQVPTLIRVAVRASSSGTIAAGLLMQHLAEGEEGRERLHAKLEHPEWEHVAVMGGSIRHEELVDPVISMEALVWRLFHEEKEVRVQQGISLTRGCRCTEDHYRKVLARFPQEELREMRNEQGEIVVDCAFCSRLFPIVM